jgi:hypothetical protein
LKIKELKYICGYHSEKGEVTASEGEKLIFK